MKRPAARLALAIALAGPFGCGGARPEPTQPAPATSSEAPPAEPGESPVRVPHTELEALEHDLAMSERRLEQQLERVALRPAPAPSPPPPATAPVAPSPPPPPPESGIWTARGSPCDLACRALASMKRAADGICRITAEGDPRCATARGRVARSRKKVEAAGCVCFSQQHAS